MSSIVLNIEKARTSLIEFLDDSNSKRANLLYINDFFSILLKSSNKLLINSYLAEFTDTYFELIDSFDVNCVDPEITKKIISQANEVLSLTNEKSKREKYNGILLSAENKLAQLTTYLSGNSFDESQQKFFFPLLEEDSIGQNNIRLSLLESVSVQIKKSDNKNSFNFIPSERELEHQIKRQVETSWQLAVGYVKKYIKKMPKHHDVVIAFDKKWGIVQGNSLGTALTLTFIKELLTYYNAPILLSTPGGTAFTGGIDDTGIIISVSSNVIKDKISAVFFSGIKTFALPKEDEAAAQEILGELNKKYPDRTLKITGVEDFEDLINRRNLIDIRKINPVIRGGKFALKHSLSFVLILALALVIMFSGLLDFDDNPAVITHENQYFKVYNKNKKLLWSEKVDASSDNILDGSSIKRKYGLLFDINNDGANEVIISNQIYQYQSQFNSLFANEIVCLDKEKNILWEFSVDTVVFSNTTVFKDTYVLQFIGIEKIDSIDVLFVIARNYYYPCAVFGIDIRNGKRVTDMLWHSGHIVEGIIQKDSTDQKIKLILGGINNGFECASLIVAEIDNLIGQAPSPVNYKLNNIPASKLIEYILIPPTDYSIALNNRYNSVTRDQLIFEDKMIRVGINEEASLGEVSAMLYYYFNPDYKISFIETGDSFQHNRDKLVKEEKLSPPLTYTAEYFEILKNNIRYWDGEKFVSHSEYSKTRIN